jgi:hypothetical protein
MKKMGMVVVESWTGANEPDRHASPNSGSGRVWHLALCGGCRALLILSLRTLLSPPADARKGATPRLDAHELWY